MTLKQLEAFYWAATAANFLVAAQRLHVSQSTLSKRIAELETQLRTSLFDRSGHRATLTEAGEQLLPLARRMLGLADEMRSRLTEGGGLRGHCRFGVGELAALTWLPDFVAQSRVQYPDLVLEPFVDLGAVLEQRLETGELDFAVVAGYSSRSTIASEAIAEVRFSWAASPALVGEQRTVNARLLQDTALITMPPAAGPTRMLEHWLAVNNLEVGRRLTCNNLAAIASLIVAGVGVGLFPQGWLKQMEARGAVVALRGRQALPALEYTFQRRRDDSRPLLASMRDLVRETVDFNKPSPLW
ncbi:MAG: LysR family transcriptional regulator [Hydrogenophaga sp.]|jgi:DNA-binding transcriptional LysR family regulator|uniref:LysR family transcriptional regulator n=1 Tax=Hydrogenophaga sp. TaxID=1904254 RepID=UPI001D9D1D4E|nr:LysR family transcriptional regulator [Hydrogenophaga sp.]MBW0172639.1 LysR family transcriptional regulator [Hydrogenophaga sp.]MBW0186366.1 LysR family transcriptional regulator [Hydrogenophaga sp.]